MPFAKFVFIVISVLSAFTNLTVGLLTYAMYPNVGSPLFLSALVISRGYSCELKQGREVIALKSFVLDIIAFLDS